MNTATESASVAFVDRIVQVDDVVAPIGGVWRTERFRVIEVTEADEDGAPAALVRMIMPVAAARSAFWVKLAELRAFYTATVCQVCGSSAHARCQPEHDLPSVGWSVRTRREVPLPVDAGLFALLQVGAGGTVTHVTEDHIEVELDTGIEIELTGERVEKFFHEWSVNP